MLSGKAWKHDLLLVVSLVMSFRSRQLSTIPAYNRQHFKLLISYSVKNSFLLYTAYHTACYVRWGAIPLHGYLTLGTHAQQGLRFLLKGRVPMALARLL